MTAKQSNILVSFFETYSVESVYRSLTDTLVPVVKELTPFGIRTLIVQPGAFTTNMINAVIVTKQITPAYKDTQLGQFVGLFNVPPSERTFKCPSDVNKGCQGIFEVVTGTGRGEGKEEHLRLVLSEDNAERTLKQTKKALVES